MEVFLALVGVIILIRVICSKPSAAQREAAYQRGREFIKSRAPLSEAQRGLFESKSSGTFDFTDFDRGVRDELREQEARNEIHPDRRTSDDSRFTRP